jgi:predicted DNA-binding antitoxin AbrB/MazE fold protein
MTTHVTAIYENGVLRPTKPLPLKDGERVEFTFNIPTTEIDRDEAIQRIRDAKSFDEWIAAANEAAKLEPPETADFLDGLNETRRQAGERLLFPVEGKGTDR